MEDKQIATISKDWYSFGRLVISDFGTQDFMQDIVSALSFAQDLGLHANAISQLSISVKRCETAYVDLMTSSIVIPSHYFNSEFYEKRFGLDADDERVGLFAISTINGNIIHELLHIAFTTYGDTLTPDTIEMLFSRTSGFIEVKKKYDWKTIKIAFNIIEDIFIESKTPKSLMPFIEACQSVLFTENFLSHIEDANSVTNAFNLAIAFKRMDWRDHPKFKLLNEGTLTILKQATEISPSAPITTRIQLTTNFLNSLEIDFEDASGEGEGEGDGGEGDEEGEGDGSEGKDGEDKFSGKLTKVEGLSGEGASIVDTIESLSDEEIEEINSEVEKASIEEAKKTSDEKKSETEFSLGDEKANWGKPILIDIMKDEGYLSPSPRVNPTSKVDTNFVKELIALRSPRNVIGIARDKGSIMPPSRLTRIVTDGKIFAKKDIRRSTDNHMEVIINIDFSGSTSGSVINNELGTAMDISKALKAARISHSVYGHTSDPSNRPLYFHIYSYDMEVTNYDFDARFANACHISLSENFDGVIIGELKGKFTQRDGAKYMLNLSDGEPCAPGYYSSAADAHTKKQIELARKEGIFVFAISVVEHVVDSNNSIYGRKFNINGSKNTRSQMARLLRGIAK